LLGRGEHYPRTADRCGHRLVSQEDTVKRPRVGRPHGRPRASRLAGMASPVTHIIEEAGGFVHKIRRGGRAEARGGGRPRPGAARPAETAPGVPAAEATMNTPLADVTDESACYEALVALLHREGLACPRCRARDGLKVHRRHRAPVLDYRCAGCGRV